MTDSDDQADDVDQALTSMVIYSVQTTTTTTSGSFKMINCNVREVSIDLTLDLGAKVSIITSFTINFCLTSSACYRLASFCEITAANQ